MMYLEFCCFMQNRFHVCCSVLLSKLILTSLIYLKSHVIIGAWHMLPSHFHAANLSDGHEFESALQHDFPVILYLHGNCGTRAGWHRVQLYKKLAKMNFHVLAFDYRGTCVIVWSRLNPHRYFLNYCST